VIFLFGGPFEVNSADLRLDAGQFVSGSKFAALTGD
jgi:hypothetical protein